MTAFQKDLIDELKDYVLEYVDLAGNLTRIIECLIIALSDEKTDRGYKEAFIESEANFRQDWLNVNDVFHTLKKECETWKALITSFEDEEP